MRSNATLSPFRAGRSFCLVCLLLLSTFAQTPKPATAKVSGRITDGAKPIPGITVTARDSTVRSSGVSDLCGRAVTDGDGRYQITDLPAGRYKIVPQHALYVVKEQMSEFGQTGRGLNLAEGENVENADFTLAKGGVIAGRVTDYDGKPAIEQQVGLLRLEAEGKWRPVNPFMNYRMRSTDDRGDYRLYGLEPGQYKVFVGKVANDGSICGGCGNNFRRRVYYPNVVDEATAQVVEVKAGEETNSIDIRLQGLFKTHDVIARVVDAQTNQPVAGVMCGYGRWIVSSKSTGGYLTGPMTGANGETLFQGVAPGTYAAFVNDGGEVYSEYAVFEVTENEAPRVEVKLYRGKSISGQIVWLGGNEMAARALARQSGLMFNLRQPNEIATSERRFSPNADGTFFITGVAPGDASIVVEFTSKQAGFRLMGIEHQGVRKPQHITMPTGSNLTDVKLYVLVPGQSSLRGQLQFVNGEFPPDAIFSLLLVPKNIPLLSAQSDFMRSASASAQADQRHQFEFARLYPGEYELSVNQPYTQRSGVAMPTLPPFKQTVHINEGSNEITIRIDLSAARKEGQ